MSVRGRINIQFQTHTEYLDAMAFVARTIDWQIRVRLNGGTAAKAKHTKFKRERKKAKSDYIRWAMAKKMYQIVKCCAPRISFDRTMLQNTICRRTPFAMVYKLFSDAVNQFTQPLPRHTTFVCLSVAHCRCEFPGDATKLQQINYNRNRISGWMWEWVR